MKDGSSHLARGFLVLRLMREDWGRLMDWRRALSYPCLGCFC